MLAFMKEIAKEHCKRLFYPLVCLVIVNIIACVLYQMMESWQTNEDFLQYLIGLNYIWLLFNSFFSVYTVGLSFRDSKYRLVPSSDKTLYGAVVMLGLSYLVGVMLTVGLLVVLAAKFISIESISGSLRNYGMSLPTSLVEVAWALTSLVLFVVGILFIILLAQVAVGRVSGSKKTQGAELLLIFLIIQFIPNLRTGIQMQVSQRGLTDDSVVALALVILLITIMMALSIKLLRSIEAKDQVAIF